MSRELTKKFEEFIRGQISEVIKIISNKDITGEMVLLIEGKSIRDKKEIEPWEAMDIKEHIIWNINRGLSKKDAIKKTAEERDIPRQQVYRESFEI